MQQLQGFLGGSPLVKANPEDIESFRASLSEKYSRNSVARKLAAVFTFYKWLQETGIITEPPTTGCTLPPKINLSTPRVLSDSDVDAIMDQININKIIQLRDRIMLSLAIHNGLRSKDIIDMNFGDIDFKRKMMFLRHRMYRRHQSISDIDFNMLRRYTDVRGLSETLHPRSALFANLKGARIDSRAFRKRVSQYTTAAGFANVSSMTLRHSFALRHIRDGISITELQHIMGHKSRRVTKNYIQDVKSIIENDPDLQRQFSAGLSRSLSKG